MRRYLGGTAAFRTDLYATCATVVSHAESIELIKSRNRMFTPELKTYEPNEGMPTYDEIRSKMIEEYRMAGVAPSQVWPQSFNYPDVEYWIANESEFADQAVLLDGTYTDGTGGGLMDSFAMYKEAGVKILAPPMHMLVKVEGDTYAPSNYAVQAKEMGFDMITWSLERTGPLANGGDFYYGTSSDFTMFDGDMLLLTHVLAKDVGVLGIFSDWPATTTFYANCMLKELTPAGQACDAGTPECALGTSCTCGSGRRLLFAPIGGQCTCM